MNIFPTTLTDTSPSILSYFIDPVVHIVDRIQDDTVILLESQPGTFNQQLAREIERKGCPVVVYSPAGARFGNAEVNARVSRLNAVYECFGLGLGVMGQIETALETQDWRTIDGWFDFADLYSRILNAVPSGGSFVEVGTWMGRSLGYMASLKARRYRTDVALYGVDNFKGGAELTREVESKFNGDFFAQFMRNMIEGGYAGQICPIRLESVEAAKLFEDGSLDAVFIDACHEYPFVKADVTAWTPKVKKGGMIAGHDWATKSVQQAVEEQFGDSIRVDGNVWICDKI